MRHCVVVRSSSVTHFVSSDRDAVSNSANLAKSRMSSRLSRRLQSAIYLLLTVFKRQKRYGVADFIRHWAHHAAGLFELHDLTQT